MYSTDATLDIIVVANNDIEARKAVIAKEYKEPFIQGRNHSTSGFWGPTVEIQIIYVSCEVIGTSFLFDFPQIICSNERHDAC